MKHNMKQKRNHWNAQNDRSCKKKYWNTKVSTWMIVFLLSFLLTACGSKEQGSIDNTSPVNGGIESSETIDTSVVVSNGTDTDAQSDNEKDTNASDSNEKDADTSSSNEEDTDVSSSNGKDTDVSSSTEKDADVSNSAEKDADVSSSTKKDADASSSNGKDADVSSSNGKDIDSSTDSEKDADASVTNGNDVGNIPEDDLAEDGIYTSKEDVAYYLFLYGHLPSNFITKKQAEKLGWQGGSLEPFAPGMCIGGNRFGNYEGLLPTKEGRFYTECDIDTLGASKRGAKRIVFSNDGLIYYTEDHYQTFELLYGEE